MLHGLQYVALITVCCMDYIMLHGLKFVECITCRMY